jgi:hypothetical protein
VYSKKRVAVDDFELEVDTSVQEFGVFRKLLDIFEAWLVWAYGHRAKLGLYSSFGLKQILGRLFKSCFGLGRMHLRAGSSKVGCRPYFKKTTKSGLDPVHDFNAFSVGLSSSLGTTLGSASSVAVVGSSSSAPKDLGCSLVEFLVSSVHASSSPPKVSFFTAVLEKFSATIPQQAALGYSPGAILSFSAAELLYPSPIDMGFLMGCSLGVGLAPSMHWKSFLSSEELSSASFNASLRSEGFSPEPIGIVGRT